MAINRLSVIEKQQANYNNHNYFILKHISHPIIMTIWHAFIYFCRVSLNYIYMHIKSYWLLSRTLDNHQPLDYSSSSDVSGYIVYLGPLIHVLVTMAHLKGTVPGRYLMSLLLIYATAIHADWRHPAGRRFWHRIVHYSMPSIPLSIKAETKSLPFHIQHFQMHFV